MSIRAATLRTRQRSGNDNPGGGWMISKERIVNGYEYFWENVWDSSDDWERAGRGGLRELGLELLPTNPGRILDLGCGNGIAMSMLDKRSITAIGCDISLRALKGARRHGDVARADGTRLPFRSDSFEHVLLLDALEHVVEKSLLVQECWRVLHNKGTIILTTPHPEATGGLGDHRQPYDRPVPYSEIESMTDGLFRLRSAKGVFQARHFRGLARISGAIPMKFFASFPILLDRSREILLVLEKTMTPGKAGKKLS